MIEESGEELIISDRGRSAMKVVTGTVTPEERLKNLRTSVLQYDNLTEPAAAEDWRILQ
jgi:hypothetical protein